MPSRPRERSSQNKDETQTALEQRKLRLETEMLEFRHELEKKKLELEIEELADARRRSDRSAKLTVATAVTSAVTTALIAALTGYITWTVAQFTDRQRSAESYASLLKDLGSATNVPARAGAVVGLTRFAASGDTDRSQQTVTILVTQLSEETDPRVLRTLRSRPERGRN
jgi:hypothetical protein